MNDFHLFFQCARACDEHRSKTAHCPYIPKSIEFHALVWHVNTTRLRASLWVTKSRSNSRTSKMLTDHWSVCCLRTKLLNKWMVCGRAGEHPVTIENMRAKFDLRIRSPPRSSNFANKHHQHCANRWIGISALMERAATAVDGQQWSTAMRYTRRQPWCF